MQTLPPTILAHLQPFRVVFLTNKTYLTASLLLAGALLCRGGRTVCGILRALGLQGETAFTKYHNVLNRSRWNTLKASRILLEQIDTEKQEALRIVIDGHLERRRGSHISGKGCYHDAVQSSRGYTVISPGLKWLSVMVLKRFSWSQRILALPFLTVLVPSEKSNKKKKKRHKTLQDWTSQMIKQIRRWLPHRKIILTADSEFAVAEITKTCSKLRISFVSRLKLNARLFDFPFKFEGKGRPRNKGLRLPTGTEMLADPNLKWESAEVCWYGGARRNVLYVTGKGLWHVMGHKPIPIRYVFMKDPQNEFNPVLLMSTDEKIEATQIIETYVSRWNIEVTFRESREHLGIETQRQWSDLAILRSTPILFALYSLVILIGTSLLEKQLVQINKTAWYQKEEVKFSDILASIRKDILRHFCKERFGNETAQNSDEGFLDRVIDLFIKAA
jgi:hypothetical protein